VRKTGNHMHLPAESAQVFAQRGKDRRAGAKIGGVVGGD